MESIVSRLKLYLDFKAIAVSLAEKEINLSNASLAKPFKNGTAIKTDTLEKFLLTYVDIDPEWLLTGKGNMLKSDGKEVISADNKIIIEQLRDKIDMQSDIIAGLKNSVKDKEKINTLLEDKISQDSSVPRGAVETPNNPNNGTKLGEEIGK
jgi:hypothetical protein